MSDKPISPLRQRLLEDMNMRRFVPDTQREYKGGRNSTEGAGPRLACGALP
jgi:hypothetical protein